MRAESATLQGRYATSHQTNTVEEVSHSHSLSQKRGKKSASRAADLGSNPALLVGLFQFEPYHRHKNWYSESGVTESALGLVGPVSCCDGVRENV